MALIDVVGSMRTRMPWEVGQKILKIHTTPRGLGWPNTLEKINEGEGDESAAEDLTDALEQHVIAGEKATRFYRVSPDGIEALRDSLRDLVPEITPFSLAYPLMLSEQQVIENHPTSPHLVAVREFETGIAAVFASTRAVEVREPVVVEDLPTDAADALAGYEELVGVRHIKSQAMDVLWVPLEGEIIDVRVDAPRGMGQDAISYAHERFRAVLHAVLGSDYLATPANLFPLIQSMYSTADEGIVVELAFGTSTASLKHEKMRRRALCLRSEAYHVGGKAALTVPIDPYKLSIQWQRQHGDVSSRPEMSLNGTHRMTADPNGTIAEAAIRKCLGFEDYEFVRARIVHFLNGGGSSAPVTQLSE